MPAADTATAQVASDPDAAFEAWGAAIDEGDWDAAWDVFEQLAPTEGPEFASLLEIAEWDPEGEARAARRGRELSLQEATAASRVRVVDAAGRAHAAGKRKTSVARAWVWPGQGRVFVNRKPLDVYFPDIARRVDVLAPFDAVDGLGAYDAMIRVQGGGVTGQAQATRHGLARALQSLQPELRAPLKAAGLLSRDARVVERKKPGRKKARKAFQWVKR